MKVAYLSSSFSTHNYSFFKALGSRGIDVHWIILVNEFEDLTSVPAHFRQLNGLYIHNFFDEYPRWVKCKVRGKINYHRLLRICHQLSFLKQRLKVIRPDVLHGNFVQYDGFKSSVSGFRPFLQMIWGDDVLILPDKHWLSKMALRYAVSKAEVVYCDCNVVKNGLKRLTKLPDEKVFMFPQLGVDLSLFYPSDEKELDEKKRQYGNRKLLITTRYLEAIYGIDILLKAVQLVREYTDIHLLIIGDGSLKSSLEKLSLKLGISECVTFFGTLANSDLPKYLRMADLYISASYSDGTAQSLLEAMACGKAVVVSDLPANAEWVQNNYNGLIFPCGDSARLSSCIRNLLADDNMRNNMELANIKIAQERADINVNTAKLMELYRSMINKLANYQS